MEDKYRPNSCINGLVCSLGHSLQSNQFNLYIDVDFDLYDHSSLGKRAPSMTLLLLNCSMNGHINR